MQGKLARGDERLSAAEAVGGDAGERSVLRLPIDRAITLLAQKGLPMRAESADVGPTRSPGARKEKTKR